MFAHLKFSEYELSYVYKLSCQFFSDVSLYISIIKTGFIRKSGNSGLDELIRPGRLIRNSNRSYLLVLMGNVCCVETNNV